MMDGSNNQSGREAGMCHMLHNLIHPGTAIVRGYRSVLPIGTATGRKEPRGIMWRWHARGHAGARSAPGILAASRITQGFGRGNLRQARAGWLVLAAGAAAISAPAARASVLTDAFAISLGSGAPAVGTFSYDSSSIVPGGSVTGPGLLTNLNFAFNGINYSTSNVSTGLLSFDSSGNLTNFRFGTNCSGNSATACSLDPLEANSWLVQGPGSSGFAYNTGSPPAFNATFGALAAVPVPIVANSTTYVFGVASSTGVPSVGTFSYGNASAVPGSNATGPGLLTNLNFAFNGINYSTSNVSTGLLSFDSSGNLTNFRFGTNCSGNSATACSLDPLEANSWLVQGPGSSGFAYNTGSPPAFNATFGALADLRVPTVNSNAVPEPGSMELLGVGLMVLGLVKPARRRFDNRKRSALA